MFSWPFDDRFQSSSSSVLISSSIKKGQIFHEDLMKFLISRILIMPCQSVVHELIGEAKEIKITVLSNAPQFAY